MTYATITLLMSIPSSLVERAKQLRALINDYRYQYHVLNQTEISEAALDSLKHELFTLEQTHPELITADSPTQRVGGAVAAGFQKITHQERMFSMEDVFSRVECLAWMERLQKIVPTATLSWFCMPKIDGLAVSLVYQDGVLMTGATRGDGSVGEDVTHNIRTIEMIPLVLNERLSGRVEVRGEIFFRTSDFEALNQEQDRLGEERFANPRNAAAGTVRQLDPKVATERKLSFFAWDIVGGSEKTQHAVGERLRTLGFVAAPDACVASDLNAVEEQFTALLERREQLDFWIDGLVVRVNERSIFRDLGVVGKTPRGLVAWKFPAEEKTARIMAIEWYVGRTGAMTPVAVFEPVEVGGTTVTHASLHNSEEIERLDVRVGDTVIIYKAGDIIPKVKSVLLPLRPKGTKRTTPPTVCPACGGEVQREEGTVAVSCINPACVPQQVERLLHVLRAFQIDGIGPQTVQALLASGAVVHPSDLFLLTPETFLRLEGFADVSAKKAVDAIQAKREVPLSRFLLALGIRHVGLQTAIDLAHHFGTIERFLETTHEELLAVQGIGAVVAQEIQQSLAGGALSKQVEEWKRVGVHILNETSQRAAGPLTGRTFVFTGTLQAFSRSEAEQIVKTFGAETASDVTRRVTDVVVGSDAGSKAKKAAEMGVSILSEVTFLSMIEGYGYRS